MAYEKTTWQPGDTITSEKLNHLEGGVEASQPFQVIVTCQLDGRDEVWTADKSTADIREAHDNKLLVVAYLYDFEGKMTEFPYYLTGLPRTYAEFASLSCVHRKDGGTDAELVCMRILDDESNTASFTTLTIGSTT